MPWSFVALAVLAGCDRVTIEREREANAPLSHDTQCVRDEDCVLLPAALTCCIECPPAPPFEAAPSWVLDGMLIENDTVCPERWRCPEVTCEAVSTDCIARAACDDGCCVALAIGCELPRS